jgi:muconolactone delta-isomerase
MKSKTKDKKMKLKKLVIFTLVFTAVIGFTAVDEAYSDMMDQEGQVSLHVRRVNDEYVTFSIFGQTATLDTKELKEDWGGFSESVTSELDHAVVHFRHFLGIVEPERDYAVFKTQIL